MSSEVLFDIRCDERVWSRQSITQVLDLLSRGMIHFSSVTLDVQKQPTPLFDDPAVADLILRQLFLAGASGETNSVFSNWLVKGEKGDYGPFSLLQILEFYKQKRISEHSLLYHSLLTDWQAMGEIDILQTKSLLALLNHSYYKDRIGRRAHPRIAYNNEVFLSSAGELYRGVCVTVSEGGVGIVTDQLTQMQVGNQVNLIINSNAEHATIQLKGTVVSVVKSMNFEKVAIQFNEVHPDLKNYIDQKLPTQSQA